MGLLKIKALSKTLSVVMICIFFSSVVVKADWESDANARIEQIRKRNTQIAVLDSNSQPVPGLTVQIEQVKHRFGFGTALAYGLLTDPDYQDFVLDHFEWAVCENEMKWASNESTRDVETYTQADYIANWCASNDIVLRGHNLVWETGSQTPSWVSGLSCSTYPPTSEMMDEIDERINSIVGRYAGQIVSWDVDNEMLSGNMFDCLGEAGRAHFFQLANSIDPNCGFYMNEYAGNSFGGYDGDPYASRAQGLIALGAPVEGLGIQGHVNSPFNPELYYSNVLEELAVVGVPIIATEFDTDATNATQVADDLENFYRICFSHPNVEGIIMWGIEQNAWRWDGIVNSDTWVLTEAGVRYEALLDEWTTSDSNYTSVSGNVNFRGFHGIYEITLSAPGQTPEVHQIELEPGTGTVQFNLLTDLEEPVPDETPPTPDPMTWTSVPAAAGSSSITMTATTASDDTPPVRYYFECTNYGSASSGWQTSPTYVAQGLNPSTQYTFRVKARDSAVVPNETGWSGTASATTEPPGVDIELLGSWTTGTSHTAEAGYSRALVFIAHAEEAGSINLSSVTYGGQPMTKVIDEIVGSSYQAYTAAFILDEAGIAAATSGTFVLTWSTTPDDVSYGSVFLQNVDQTVLVGASDSASSASATPNPITTGALSTDEGDMVIVAATCGNTNDYTVNNGFTEAVELDMSSSTGVEGYKLATGADETPSLTGTNVNRQVIIGFVVNAQEATGYSNCSEVIAGGYRLASDIAGTGDCYVDYYDLDTFVDYWLDDTCTGPDNCHGADFEPTDGVVDLYDFSDFANQWLTCNNPTDSNCTPNW